MNRLNKNTAIISLSLFIGLSLASCEKDGPSYFPEIEKATENTNSEGTVLSFLNGFVTLDMQPGAVSNTSAIKVSELLDNECDYMDDCNWILKLISIESQVTFQKTINVSLKYDQNQVNSTLSVNGNPPNIYYWPTREDFDTHARRETLFFETDQNNKVLKFEIKKPGLYAIGLNI